MATTWDSWQRAYNLVIYEWADPRSQHLPLVTRPFSLTVFMIGYMLFVTRWGPRLMRHREPFQLKNTLVVYNALQVLANFYLFYMGATKFWFATYNWRCEPVDRSNSPSALEILRLVNLYFRLKLVDLLDTIFFVLRKKNSQITFLHVYHHTMMVALSMGGLKYFPGGHLTFLGLVNTLVHVVMYSYYLVSAVYPHSIWWKKYVTQMQLFQHCIVGLHMAQLLVHNPCKHCTLPVLVLLPNAVLITFLFLRFYWRAYGAQEAVQSKVKSS